MKQNEIFLQSEGDAYFARNKKGAASPRRWEDDAVYHELVKLVPASAKGIKVLEIGCSDGTRLDWIRSKLNAECFGIEPSAQAVKAARAKGISVQQGTADVLPFDSQSFDIVIFGFCLYVCDREDLFRIASEADRVLRTPGWLMILDFYSQFPQARNYRHRTGVLSFKMDYRTLFSWHPDYECMTHKVRHHTESNYTDAQEEWVAVSVLRKNLWQLHK